jgi:enoyl-CoA hydratase/carnithine racemase
MNQEAPVLYERVGRLALITFNRPEKLNAINGDMQRLLRQGLTEAKSDDSVRVVILRGRGRAFSSGADLGGGGPPGPTEQGQAQSPRPERGLASERQGNLDGLLTTGFMAWDLPKPVICQIQGYCLGIANVLASLTDMRIVAKDAQIGWPSLPMGGALISPFWAWYAGPAKAKEFSMIIGKKISGDEAVSYGWANQAVPAGDLEATTIAFGNEIAKVSSDLLAIKKAAINHQMESMGFRRGVMLAAEMNTMSHHTTPVGYIAQKRAELGLRGTYEWWDNEDGIP